MFLARFAILSQKLSNRLQGKTPRRIVLALVLPFVGVMAAFGIAPDTMTDTVERNTVVEELKLPPLVMTAAAPDQTYWREVRIERGDTIASVLQRLDVDQASAVLLLQHTRDARALYRLIPGRTIRAHVSETGQLLALRYLNGTQLMKVDLDRDVLRVWEGPADVETRVHMRSGEIVSSLFAATDAAGMSDAIAVQIADVFSTDIDFHRDLRRGDRFSAVYEMQYHQGEPIKAG